MWRIDRAGSLDRLRSRTEDVPGAESGQACIAVHAVGVNFADIFACLGLYSATPSGSFVPGLEFSGRVEALGPGRPDPTLPVLRVGDAVWGVTRFGGYATTLNVDVRYLRPVRDGWSFAEAAAFPVQALTAWYGLIRLGEAAAGKVVLLHSAAGGVGLQALTMLTAVGARTIATVGQEAKRRWLVAHRALSPEQVIVRDRRTFATALDRALTATGADGFDLVFDAVAGPFLLPAYERLRPEGRLVVYGAADFMTQGLRVDYTRLVVSYLRRPRIDPLRMINENRSVMGFNLIWLWDRVDRFAEALDAARALNTDPPQVGRTFPFAEAPAAMRYLQSGNSIGKVVLEIPDQRPDS